jgi:pimeloyl-ACP methyl ester carboxylesterase
MTVCVVLAHGFTNSMATPHVAAIARGMAAHGVGVLSFDFRGHGRSGGHSTVGDYEVLDVEAALAAARRLGYRKVVTCGWSMGASVVLRHAAIRGGREHGKDIVEVPDAVIAVSALSRWYYRDTAAMRRVLFAIEKRSGRAVARLFLRTRISGRQWDPVPLSPVEAIAYVAPIPLLVVHGDQDQYFPLEHPEALVAASAGHAELWLEQGMGHAEKAATPELIARLAAFATRA